MPLRDTLYGWIIESFSQIDKTSELAATLHHLPNRWESLCRYMQDGRLEIANNIAGRSIRGIAIAGYEGVGGMK